MKKRTINKLLGMYPANEFLNNALSFLARDPPDVDMAIEEIQWAILKAGGHIRTDLKIELEDRGKLI